MRRGRCGQELPTYCPGRSDLSSSKSFLVSVVSSAWSSPPGSTCTGTSCHPSLPAVMHTLSGSAIGSRFSSARRPRPVRAPSCMRRMGHLRAGDRRPVRQALFWGPGLGPGDHTHVTPCAQSGGPGSCRGVVELEQCPFSSFGLLEIFSLRFCSPGFPGLSFLPGGTFSGVWRCVLSFFLCFSVLGNVGGAFGSVALSALIPFKSGHLQTFSARALQAQGPAPVPPPLLGSLTLCRLGKGLHLYEEML